MKEPVDHIERPRLPWRDKAEPSLTECGIYAVKVRTISRDDLKRRLKEWGQQRTALMTCYTCLQTATRWVTWEEDPRQMVDREIQWEGRWDNDRGFRLRDELRAIEKLIELHSDDFASLVKQVQGTIDFLTEKRKIKMGKP